MVNIHSTDSWSRTAEVAEEKDLELLETEKLYRLTKYKTSQQLQSNVYMQLGSSSVIHGLSFNQQINAHTSIPIV